MAPFAPEFGKALGWLWKSTNVGELAASTPSAFLFKSPAPGGGALSLPVVDVGFSVVQYFYTFGGALSAAQHPVIHVLFHLILAVIFIFSFSWLFWLGLSVLLTVLQLIYAIYQLIRISLDLSLISTLKFWTGVCGLAMWPFRRRSDASRKERVEKMARSLKSFEHLSALDEGRDRGTVEWREGTKDLPQAPVLEKTTEKLRRARLGGRYKDVQFALSGLLKRGHLGLQEEGLHSRCANGTKFVIEAFQEEVGAALCFTPSHAVWLTRLATPHVTLA